MFFEDAIIKTGPCHMNHLHKIYPHMCLIQDAHRYRSTHTGLDAQRAMIAH